MAAATVASSGPVHVPQVKGGDQVLAGACVVVALALMALAGLL